MPGVRAIVAALIASAAVGGCSSTGAPGPSSAPPSVDETAAAVQQYLDAVNRLCDALLPKVDRLTSGGRLDIPLDQFFNQLPAHQHLRDDFDRDVAQIPVPPAAKHAAAALAAYVEFANELDERRLMAARQGPAAYQREIRAELRSAADDPSIAARDAAGFHESCNAR